MVENAWDQVGRALEVLAAGLAPFVGQRMSDVERRALKDPRFQLKVMIEAWNAFSPPLTKMERNLVFELRETGNRWAHYEPLTDDDVDRALDSVERLLAAAGAPEAAVVREAKAELRRSRYVHDSQHGDSGAPPDPHSSPSRGQPHDAEGHEAAVASRAGSFSPGGSAAPSRRSGGMALGRENWRLILAAARSADRGRPDPVHPHRRL